VLKSPAGGGYVAVCDCSATLDIQREGGGGGGSSGGLVYNSALSAAMDLLKHIVEKHPDHQILGTGGNTDCRSKQAKVEPGTMGEEGQLGVKGQQGMVWAPAVSPPGHYDGPGLGSTPALEQIVVRIPKAIMTEPEGEEDRDRPCDKDCDMFVVRTHLLMGSSGACTGYRGVTANHGSFRATCFRKPCLHVCLGTFGKAEQASMCYIRHMQEIHGLDTVPVSLSLVRPPASELN
jgi:hypothetical protein